MDVIKELTYKKRGEDIHYPPLRYYTMGDKTLVAFYQGFRGGNPELDFIVKYKEKGKRLRTPSHTHWIVDLLVKSERNKEMVGRYIDDMIEMYENVEPFKTHNERDSYELVFSPFANEKYNELSMAESFQTHPGLHQYCSHLHVSGFFDECLLLL